MTWLELIALLGYCLLSWHYFMMISSKGSAPFSSPALAACIQLLALACHATAFTATLQLHPWHFGASEALSLTALLSIVLYLTARSFLPIRGIELPVMAFAALLLGSSMLLPTGHLINTSPDTLNRLHFATALLAQPLLINATGIALLIKFSDRQLHGPARGALAKSLPPVLTLERLLFLTVGCTFLTLSATLATGLISSLGNSGAVKLLSHKVLFSTMAWGVLGALLVGHHQFGWRGRKAANLALAGAALLFLGYIGTRLVLEAILQR